jgi:hypothetical protein
MIYIPIWVLTLITLAVFIFGAFLGHINKGEKHGSN